MNETQDPRFFHQRNLIGVVAVICLAVALYFLFFSAGQNSSIGGILVKVGLMLAAIWLAYPGFKANRRATFLSMIILFGLLVLVAARPRVFVIAFAVAVIALTINQILLRFSQRG